MIGLLTRCRILLIVCNMKQQRLVAQFKTREQATYEALRQAIIEGRWGPEEPLVASRIAVELGVSRITVANALKRLAGEGFVRLSPHKEAIVARPDPADVRELYLMRAELEALAAREAAEKITPEELERCRQINESLQRLHAEPSATMRDLRAVDREFHRQVRLAARMPRLAEVLLNLADQCEYYRSRLLDPSRLAAPDPEAHVALLRLLAGREADAAAHFMREHVLQGMRALLSALEAER